MKITKYPQSCLLVECSGQKILVDPNVLLWDDSFLTDWQDVGAVFITHKHRDHCYPEKVAQLQNVIGVKVYAPQEVANTCPPVNYSVICEGEEVIVGQIKVRAVRAVHGYLPNLKNGGEPQENFGFLIDDGQQKLYITGDTICFNSDTKCDIIALPVSGCALVMGLYEAPLFAAEAGAKFIIPTHWDHPSYPVSMNELNRCMDGSGIKYQILEVRGTLEL